MKKIDSITANRAVKLQGRVFFVLVFVSVVVVVLSITCTLSTRAGAVLLAVTVPVLSTARFNVLRPSLTCTLCGSMCPAALGCMLRLALSA